MATMQPYRVHKYPVPITDRFTLALPQWAQILDVQAQGSDAMLWALVAPDEEPEERRFRLVGTGHPIDADERWWLNPIGTFQLAGGALVFHLFEVMSNG